MTLSLRELGGKQLPTEVYYLQLIQSETFIWCVCWGFFSWNPLWLIVNSLGKSFQYLLTALFLVLPAIPWEAVIFGTVCATFTDEFSSSLSLLRQKLLWAPCTAVQCSPSTSSTKCVCLSRFPLCCTNLCNPSRPPLHQRCTQQRPNPLRKGEQDTINHRAA